METYVVIRSVSDGFDVVYCGLDKDEANQKLYRGERANVEMQIWNNGSYVKSKWGNLKHLQETK